MIASKSNGNVHPVKELYSPKEAVEYLAYTGAPFTEGTLAVWRSRGQGPEFVKIRNRAFYTEAGLRDFVKGRRVMTVDSCHSATA